MTLISTNCINQRGFNSTAVPVREKAVGFDGRLCLFNFVLMLSLHLV